jgi:uncharacterized coiled-coil DUF342 family protein
VAININIHVHHHDSGNQEIHEKLNVLIEGQKKIMAKAEELAQELVEINTTTNELAADVDDLVKQGVDGLTPEAATAHLTKLQELKVALQGIAAKHTPANPEG